MGGIFQLENPIQFRIVMKDGSSVVIKGNDFGSVGHLAELRYGNKVSEIKKL